MVRGNWQKRVETAHARRKETRQRKLRRESRGHYKSLVQNQLWDFLDRYNDDILGHSDYAGAFIHIWTDIMPVFHESDRVHNQDVVDTYCNNIVDKNRNLVKISKPSTLHSPNVPVKGRRHSFDETLPQPLNKKTDVNEQTAKKKGRHNSFDESIQSTQSNDESKPSPSSFPRTLLSSSSSSSSSIHENIDNGDSEHYLCRKFFFLDTCPHVSASKGSSKKGSGCTCLYEHYPKNCNNKSLAQVLLTNVKSVQNYNVPDMVRHTLESSSKACAIALAELDDLIYDENNDTGDGHIDMLYNISISIRGIEDGTALLGHATKSSPNDAIDDAIGCKKISKALSQHLSQVKCPMGSVVYLTIGSTLVFDRYQGGLIPSSFATLPSTQSSPTKMTSKVSLPFLISRLSDSVLEHIVSFLPNEASGILPLVCKQWYHEIGTNSPALWKSLLERNKWPSLRDEHENRKRAEGLKPVQIYRDLFISHYSVVRQLTCLFTEVKKIGAPSSHAIQKINQENCLTLSYSDRNETLSDCIDILRISDSSILVAYQNCSMRLFDVTLTPLGHILKHILLIRIAPFGISKKTSTLLRGIGMDAHVILCSYSVHNSKRRMDPSSKCWLATVHRDDFLCMSNGATHDEINEFVHVSNIWQRVLDFLPKIIDHAPDRFADFLIEGGSISDLYIKIGKELVSLNGGRFMFLAHILTGPDDDEFTTQLTAVSLIFSTSSASILWMEFLPLTLRPELGESVNLYNMQHMMNSKAISNIVAVPSHGSHIIFIIVDAKNNVAFREIYNESKSLFWEFSLTSCCLLLPQEIVLANECESACQLSFLPYDERNETTSSSLIFHDVCNIRRLQQVGDHLIAEVNFWSLLDPSRSTFGFIIIHIVSRCEVHRYRLEEYDPIGISLRHRSLLSDNMSVFVVSSVGGTIDSQDTLIVSSSVIKNIDKSQNYELDVTKKKPKKSIKIAKKDGYARGMTQRG